MVPAFIFLPTSLSHLRRLPLALCCVLILMGATFAQEAVTIPHLIKFTGTISSSPARTVGVIFALYGDQTGGAPLWQEVQTVAVDAAGRYSTLLGAHTVSGMPSELFSDGQARWLGVQPEGQLEQPRVLLVSVPYAMKAADAETLGGLPPSAFLRAGAVADPPVTAPPASDIKIPGSGTPADSPAGPIVATTITASGLVTIGVGANSTAISPTTGVVTPLLLDQSSLVLNPLLYPGADMCAQISAAFVACIEGGATSCTVDARRWAYAGRQKCAGSPFAGVTNNGTFSGVLMTQGSQITMANAALPIVVPGGMTWDGDASRSLPDPGRAYVGTTIQPASPYSNGAVISLGSAADNAAPQGTVIRRLAVGCVPLGGTYTPGANTIGVLNANAEEMSGGEFIFVEECQTGYDIEQATNGLPPHSGFDSMGFSHSGVVVPYDANAVGIEFGGSSVGGLGHVYGFHDFTISGPVSGVSPGPALGTGVDIEGSDTILESIRCEYVNTCVAVGMKNGASNLLLSDVVNAYSNSNNALQSLITLGPHVGYSITIINALTTGIYTGTATILIDSGYPSGPCTLLAATEGGLSFYSRGVGGGGYGVVLSTARTACNSTGFPSATTTTTNTWSAPQEYAANLLSIPTGTATASKNYSSYLQEFCTSDWNGSASVYLCGAIQGIAGSGLTPSFTYKFSPVTGAGSTLLDLSALSAQGVTFPAFTFTTNSASNKSQSGVNIASGLGVKVTNTASTTVTLALATGSPLNTDVAGSLTLSIGYATYTFKGTYATPPICTASDTTQLSPVKPTATTTTLTLQGNKEDQVSYICIPRT